MNFLQHFSNNFEVALFGGFFNRDFAELLEVLHKGECGLAGACSGSLVALCKLILCIPGKQDHLCTDLF